MSTALEKRSHSATALAQRGRPGILGVFLRAIVRYRVATRVSPETSSAHGYRTAEYKPEGSLARPAVIEAARKAGLRFVGVYEYPGLLGWLPREGWVSEDGAVRVSARRDKASGIEGQMSAYFLSTTLDDGVAVLTWAKNPPPIGDSRGVVSQGGSGDLVADLAAHRKAVERRMADAPGTAPVVAATVDDCVALSTYFDRCLTTDDLAWSLVRMRLLKWSAIAFVVAMIVRFLVATLLR